MPIASIASENVGGTRVELSVSILGRAHRREGTFFTHGIECRLKSRCPSSRVPTVWWNRERETEREVALPSRPLYVPASTVCIEESYFPADLFVRARDGRCRVGSSPVSASSCVLPRYVDDWTDFPSRFHVWRPWCTDGRNAVLSHCLFVCPRSVI